MKRAVCYLDCFSVSPRRSALLRKGQRNFPSKVIEYSMDTLGLDGKKSYQVFDFRGNQLLQPGTSNQ
jgi:hypothetical protein